MAAHSSIVDARGFRGAVVRAIDEDGIFRQAVLLQHGAHFPHTLVKVSQGCEQVGMRFAFKPLHVFLRRKMGTVGDVGRDIAEERFARCLRLFDEPGRFVEPNVRAEALVLGLLPVMKIPVVEAIVPPHVTDRCYRAVAMDDGFLEPPVNGAMWIEIAQMPFAEDAGAIPIGGKHVGYGGRFAGYQTARNSVGAEPHMPTMSSCQQSRPGGSAHRGDVKIGQPDTFGMQLVQVRCLEPGVPMTAQIPVTLVIRHDQNDVGLLR